MTAAIPKERTNDSGPAARPPADDTSRAAGSLNAPPYLATAAGMLVATSTQASVSFWPTSGSSASHRGQHHRDADQPDQQRRPAITEPDGQAEMQRIQHHR